MDESAKPPWWQAVTEADSVRESGIEWRQPGEWTPADETSDGGTLSNEVTRALDAEIREGKLLVGTGPSITMRGMGIDIDAHWYLDPAAPEKLWCALGYFFDARLWIPVDPTPDALAEVLSSSHPKPESPTRALTGFARGFLGFRDEVLIPNVYDGQMVPFNGHDLDRYTTMMSYLEHSSWGSAHAEDPYRDDFEAVSPLEMGAYEQQHQLKAQLLGRVPSMTWRALHSRALLSFEIHARGLVFAAVRYRPTPKSHHVVVERLNAALDMNYPLDLPLDVLGALTCFDFLTEPDLAHLLDEPESGQHLATALHVYAALWHGDVRATLRLREFVAHPEPEVRRAVRRVAADYNYRFLFEEAALADPRAEDLEQLERFLIFGGEPDNYNAFGDHFAGQQPVMVDKEGREVEVYSDFIGDELAEEAIDETEAAEQKEERE